MEYYSPHTVEAKNLVSFQRKHHLVSLKYGDRLTRLFDEATKLSSPHRGAFKKNGGKKNYFYDKEKVQKVAFWVISKKHLRH